MLFLIVTITHNHARLPLSPLPLWPIASLRQHHQHGCHYHQGPNAVTTFLPPQPETSSPVTPGPSSHHLHPSSAHMTSYQQSFLCHLMCM